MVEDRLLVLRFRRGSRTALSRIYTKYYDYLLTVATALLADVPAAEDVVHDVFLSLAQPVKPLRISGNLKWFLATCVANRARDSIRKRQRRARWIDRLTPSTSLDMQEPESSAICNEEMQHVSRALGQIPYEQREVIVLRTRGRMTFRAIAELQQLSVTTVLSRYRYGMDKLRTLLNGRLKS